MTMNFWQWIGLVVLAVALFFIIRREMGGSSPDNTPVPSPSVPSAPATAPAV
jgi:hypothetical protein